MERGDAVNRSVDLIRDLPHWHVVGFDSLGGVLHAVRVWPVLGLVDQVKLRFDATPEGCSVSGQSWSRIAFLSLGRNDRNLREIGRVLRAQLR
jgi:hypothetical protein